MVLERKSSWGPLKVTDGADYRNQESSGNCLPMFREQRQSPQPGLSNSGLKLANFTLAVG